MDDAVTNQLTAKADGAKQSRRRQDTKLEAQGAEFLVLGSLLVEGIDCYKAYVNFPGYDVVAVNPDRGRTARIQVKSRWATDNDKSVLISTFECDFVVCVFLNRGYRLRKKQTKSDTGVKPPQFFVFPVKEIKEVPNSGGKWPKALITRIKDYEEYENKWWIIGEFLGYKKK